MIDQQSQMALQEAAGFLRVLLSSPDPDALIAENLGAIDYTFMQVLAANIQEAERRGEVNAAAQLKTVYDRIVAILQEAMPPELRFINQLLSTQSENDARNLIAERAGEFGEPLLEAMEVVEQQLLGRGDPALLQKLAFLRDATERALG